MTWKSYAAVSGATVLAGWLASSPPASVPSGSTAAQRTAPVPSATTGSDIEEQAARLQERIRREATYQEPARNPFRFGAAPSTRSASADVDASPEAVPELPEAPLVPPPPAISLAGIAEDQVGERMERTAILSTPSDVLLVREGDEVMGQYRVVRIEAGAVELVTLADGSSLRLQLKP